MWSSLLVGFINLHCVVFSYRDNIDWQFYPLLRFFTGSSFRKGLADDRDVNDKRSLYRIISGSGVPLLCLFHDVLLDIRSHKHVMPIFTPPPPPTHTHTPTLLLSLLSNYPHNHQFPNCCTGIPQNMIQTPGEIFYCWVL